MAQEITPEAHLGLEPMRGRLDGTFEEVLDYLDWSINVFAGKGNMDVKQKGQAFADAVRTLKERYGMGVSTYYLKQFCDKHRHKNLHIAYMLSLADYKTEPTKTSFKGAVVNGRRTVVPKIFDILVPKDEWEAKEKRAEEFKQECIAFWDARDKELERQRMNEAKLKICSSLSGEEVSPAELDELCPDLKKHDLEMQKIEMSMQRR